MITSIISHLRSPATWMLSGRAIQYASQMALVLVLPKVLVPEEYIQFNLVLPLAFLGATLSFGWLTNAIVRHVYELLDSGNGQTRSTVVIYYGAVSAIYMALFMVISAFVASPYRLVTLLIAAVGLKNAILGLLNSSGRGKGFLLANAGFAVSLVVFILLCAGSPERDVSTAMAVWGGLDIMVALLAWWGLGILDRRSALFRFDWQVAARYARYGAPLVLNMLGVWVISLSDRYLLTLWVEPDAVAAYVLSYQLAGSAITVPMSFLVATLVPRILYLDRREGHSAAMAYNRRVLGRYLKHSPLIFVVACAVVLLFKYFIYPDYRFEPLIIILIVLAHVIYSLVHFYNKEFELNGRTLVITRSVIIGAVANVGLNVLLIPVVGATGAALATLAAYMLTVYAVRSAA